MEEREEVSNQYRNMWITDAIYRLEFIIEESKPASIQRPLLSLNN